MGIRLDDYLEQEEAQSRLDDAPKAMRLDDYESMEPVDVSPEFENGILEVPDDLREKWKAQGEIGFFEQWGRLDKTEMIPFWGSVESLGKSVSLLNTVNRLREDKYADEAQRESDTTRVKNFLLRQEEERIRGVKVRSQILTGVSQLPAFMVEFMSTGGAAAIGKQATKEAATIALRKGANVALTKLAARMAAPVASAAARTLTVQQAPRIAAGISERMLNANLQLTDKGVKIREEAQEKPFTSIMKGFGDVLIENYSEQAGEVFLEKFINKGISHLIPKKMAASMEKVFSRFKPGEAASKLWTAAGYNGFLAEMGEERLGAFLRAVTGVEDFGAENPDSMLDRITASIPNAEELLVEAGVLAVPGLGRGISAAIFRSGKGGKSSPDTTREITDQEADAIAAMGKPGDEGQTQKIDIQIPPEINEAVQKELEASKIALAPKEAAQEAPAEAQVQDRPEDTSFDFGANIAQELQPSEENPAISRLERKLGVITDLKEKADIAKEALKDLKIVTDFLYRGVNVEKSRKFFSVERLDEIPSRFKSTADTAMSLDEMAEAVNQANLGVRLESDDQLIDFMKSVVAQESRLQQIVEEGKVEFLKKRETTVLKQRIKDLQAGQRAGKVMAREEVKTVQDEIRQLVMESDLEPKDRDKFTATLKNTLTQKKLEKILPDIARRISELEETAKVKDAKAKIEAEIKATKTRKQSGKPVGKFTAEIQEVLDKLRATLKMSKDEAAAKITENLKQYEDRIPPEEVVVENRILSIAAGMDEMSSAELNELLLTIRDVKAAGRTLSALIAKERREFVNESVKKVVAEITGGKGTDPAAGTFGVKDADKINTVAAAIQAWGRFSVFSWDNLLGVLSGKTRVRPGQSFIESFGSVFAETLKEKAGRRTAIIALGNMVEDSYNVDSKGSLEILRENARPVSLGNFTNARGEKGELVMSKDQAIKKYMEMLDPTLEDTFNSEKGMAWTPEIKNAVDKFLTKKDKAFAAKQLEFYRSYYQSVNAVYREIYGTNLPFNEFYSPIRREGIGGKSLDGFGEFIQEAAIRRSVTSGSLKSRIANVRPLEFTGSSAALQKHVEEMERFKAWAVKIRDLHAVFGHPEVKQAVKENYGSGTYQSILSFLDDFARGGVHRSKRVRWMDTLRTRFTQSKLAVRPKILITQLTGTFAYMEELTPKEFAAGVFDFWKDPIGNYKKLKDSSVFLQTRGEHIDRDIKDAILTEDFSSFRKHPSFLNSLMLNVQLGDKGAVVIGGWAVYKAAVDKGMSHEDAIRKFEEVSNRTQQSGDLAEQNEWQRAGSFGKLFSMFLSSPNQYLRREVMAIINAKNKRIPVKEAAKTLMIYHFMLPMIFQFVSDFFTFRPEKQLRAALMGSLNGLFVVGDFLELVASKFLGIPEGFQVSSTPLVSIGDDIIKALFAIDWDDVTIEDVGEAVQNALSVAGSFTGLPLKEVSKMILHSADIYNGNYLTGVGGMMGWGESVLDDLESGGGGFA